MKLNLKVALPILFIHLLALVGLFFWSWEGFTIFCVLYPLTAMGVTVGYHRYLTHRGFRTFRIIRWTLAVLGVLSGEGPPIMWVSFHRKHHQFSDEENDPHSPLHGGFLHAHVLWLLWLVRIKDLGDLFRKYAKDLYEERFMRFLNKTYPLWHLGMIVLLGVGGYVYGGWYYAVSFVAYGFFVRMVFVLNITWAVNSVTHLWGYRNYATSDNSKNNWFVGLLSFGEGWHNNHHAHPTIARHGHRWWEVDTSYWLICFLKFLHLIWDVEDAIPGVKT